MNKFKEWLSDNLRYVLLFLAGVLFAGIIWIGIRVYQQYDSPTSGQNIEILPEQETAAEKITEKDTEKDTEKKKESESEKKKDAQQKESEKKQDTVADGETESTGQSDKDSSDSNGGTDANAAALAGLGTNETGTPQTSGMKETQQSEQIVDVEPETQAQTQPPTEAEPVYMTLNQACNFRSGPGYEYEVVAEYWAGTVVEYLGMVEGWAEVRIDGTVGYMGRQFLG